MAASVSVALCTHNGSRYVRQQVASILAQSTAVDEIVLGDDASTDDTVAIVTSLAAEARVPLRVLLSPEPLGITKNFERTILACSGDFVALSDQDDVWHVDRVERSLIAFDLKPTLALVHADAVLTDADGAPLGVTLFEALGVSKSHLAAIETGMAFDVYLKRNLATGATTMLRRSLAELTAPFPSSWVHDEWLAIVAAARDELGVVAGPVIDYRQHKGNLIGARRLSPAGKFRRMVEPGAGRNIRLLQRATDLASRIGDIPDVSSERVAAAHEKLIHECARSALSSRRIARVVPVLSELRTGRYRRFGRGPSDAVRDLLQPLNDAV